MSAKARIKSPLGRVLGLGAAGTGTEHFLAQRLTAIALVPLTLWFALSLLSFPSLDFYSVSAWVAGPVNAILLVMLVLAAGLVASLWEATPRAQSSSGSPSASRPVSLSWAASVIGW